MSSANPQFPLYDTLMQVTVDRSTTPLSEAQRDFFLERMKSTSFDKNVTAFFYLLIHLYWVSHAVAPHVGLPYGAKILKKGLRFDVDLLPAQLQQMVFEFLKMNVE